MNANLLVTFDPSHKSRAMEEVKSLLEEAGASAKITDMTMEGIFLLHADDPKEVVKNIAVICREDFSKFVYTNKWIPIETWISSEIESMKKAIAAMQEKIDDSESWKLDLAKRNYDKYGTFDLITELTESIDKPKVDLKNPDKIIKVEIVGEKAGISLLKPDELLDVNKIKKEAS